MIRNIRDIAITLFLFYTMCIMFWIRLQPEQVGMWQANVEYAFLMEAEKIGMWGE